MPSKSSMRLVFLALVCLAVLAITALASGGVGHRDRTPAGPAHTRAY
jgi:hypothetical protein